MGFQLFFVLYFINPVLVLGKAYFTAAVFEHRPRDEGSMDPKEIVSSNLQFFEKAARVAANKGADIIVFNEFGIFPYNKDRKILKNFVEPIPDPEKKKFNLCVDGEHDVAILSTLSCMAKKNNLYLVASVADKQLCEGTCNVENIESCNQKCPEDGILMYNTAVAFDRKGNLIARYRKTHPFFWNYNFPEDPEFVSFKTEFGIFGLIIGLDSIYESTVILAQEYGIDTLILPVFWFDDVIPFNSVEWQQALSVTNKVNLLAANTHIPANGSLGSGIYSKKYGSLVYSYEPDGESKLLMANVPTDNLEENPSEFNFNPSITVIHKDGKYLKVEAGDAFPIEGYYTLAGPVNSLFTDYRVYKSQMESFNSVKLQSTNGELEMCKNDFCCKLNYQTVNMTEEYYFGVFSGLNNFGGYLHWCEETCLLVRCDPLNKTPCLLQPTRSKTIFQSFTITGDFFSEYVYPAVTKNKFRLAPKTEWIFERMGSKNVLKFKSHTDEPLIKAGLLGRCYARDPPFQAS